MAEARRFELLEEPFDRTAAAGREGVTALQAG